LLVSALRAWKKPLAAESAVPTREAKHVIQQDDYVARVEEELKKRN